MRSWNVALALSCGMAACGTSMAQAPVVAAVEFSGAQRTTEAFRQGLIRTQVGQGFDQAVVDADVTRLLESGKFLSVKAETQTRPDGVLVRFLVEERPVIAEIRFSGNVKFKEKKLLEAVPAKVGDPVDSFGVREGREAILTLYREKGYGEANVTIDEALLADQGVLLYQIEEGPRIRVRKILFEGNPSIPPKKLLGQIQTRTYIWIFRDGNYDADQVASDASAVQTYYRDQGFLDARAGHRVERSADGRDLTIIFTIVEGIRYAIEAVRFEGNTVFTDDQILVDLSVRAGNPILAKEVERDVKAVEKRYGEQGYIYSEVRTDRVFSETPGLVVLTLKISEGEPFQVGRVVVRGNDRTLDKVVRREVHLFPGDLFNLTEAKDAERRLVETQIFGKAGVTPQGDTPGVRDALVNVEEATKAGDFIFGVGVSSDSGLIGSIVLDIKNFSLRDWPRNFSEFVKLRSFHGAGQRLRLEAQPGTEVTRFRIDFVEPYLMDKPVRLGTSAYYFERERDSYDERRIGANVSLGKRLRWKFLEGWYGEVAFRVETVKISDLELFAPRDVRDVEGDSFLTSVKGSLVRDRTDSRMVPTKGDRLSVSWEQAGAMGGDYSFSKLNASYAWHKTLYTDVEERKSVLTLRASGGTIFGDAPVFERFYGGGIGSMRGFEFRGISPRAGLKDYRVGGDMMLLTGAEYSFPLYADAIRGVFFTDMGTVEEDYSITGWRASVGFGIRLQIEFFGPVPMEFDLALPIASQSEDDEQVFSFFIGTVF